MVKYECMFKEVRKNHNLVQILLILLIIAVGSYVLGLVWMVLKQFIDVLIIILVAWLLSFLLDPVVDFIQDNLKLSKILATTITYLLLTITIVAIGFIYIPLISTQIVVLVNIITKYLSTAPAILNNLNGPIVSQIENSIVLIPSIGLFFFSAFMVLILSFYFLIDQKRINKELFSLLPSGWHKTLEFTEKVINDTFISFFRVQFFYGISTALVTWLVMILFGTGFAVSVAFLSGVFAVIPLVGPLLAIILPVLVAMLVNPIQALLVGVILFIVQQVIFNVIGPKLLGKALSLHPAIILISLLVGLKFAGALGAVFAIPVLGIGVVMIKKFGLKAVETINKRAL